MWCKKKTFKTSTFVQAGQKNKNLPLSSHFLPISPLSVLHLSMLSLLPSLFVTVSHRGDTKPNTGGEILACHLSHNLDRKWKAFGAAPFPALSLSLLLFPFQLFVDLVKPNTSGESHRRREYNTRTRGGRRGAWALSSLKKKEERKKNKKVLNLPRRQRAATGCKT